MSLPLKEGIIRHCELRLPREENSIKARADLLEPVDRELIMSVMVLGQSVRTVARMTRISPSTLRRRVRRLLSRISSPEFIATARSLHMLNDTQSAVARYHILQGKTMRVTARIMGMPYYKVRKSLAEVVGIAKGMRNISRIYPTS